MAPSVLLHDALLRSTALQQSLSTETAPLTLANLSLLSEDDDLISVLTPAPSPSPSIASTPSQSRSSSPTRRSSSKGGSGKPRRDKTKEREKADGIKNSRDPLALFPGEVCGRVFAHFGVRELLDCGVVCKRWRRSMTLNYTWYLLLQSQTYTPTPVPTASGSTLPTWRRGDSKIDWSAQYAAIHRPVVAEEEDETVEGVDDDGITMREEREEKWREENEGVMQGMDKVEARKFYKSLGNSKVKGKSWKGGEQTWTDTPSYDEGI